jgi:hypothetical protein
MRYRSFAPFSVLLVFAVALSAQWSWVPAAMGAGTGSAALPAAEISTSAIETFQGDSARGVMASSSNHSLDPRSGSSLPFHQQDSGLDPADLCSGPYSVDLTASDLCTHGPDPAPPGLDITDPVAPLRSREARLGMESIGCEGDGQSGFRIQVLYVHGADVPSRYDEFRTSIQGWVAAMGQIVQAGAAETGGFRSPRFVHDATCQPTVTAVEVSPAGDGSFDATITALKTNGFNRTDRIYLAFVDTTAAGYCGIGTVWNDDRANLDLNRNNVGPAFSRVDAGCWSGEVAAHEVMHNLGGVQHSAPNASGGFHCVDEWDVMCYQDGPRASARVVCPDQTRDETGIDCNNDDYFHTNPPARSYLATHWNPANSRFLIGANELPAAEKQKRLKKSKDSKKNKKQGGKNGKAGKNKRR